MDMKNRSLSRRMFLKVAGWLTLAGGMINIPGMARAQEKRDVISEKVRFEGKGGALGGYLSRPAGKGPYPGVIVIHENRGITDYIQDVTRNLAQEGYVGLSVNLLSRSLGPDYPGGSDEAMNALGKLSDAEAMADLDAGVENAIFLRAERQTDGGRTFKLNVGEPLQTSYGEDLYRTIFGTEK